MFLSRMRMRRNPERARAHTRAICASEAIKDKTIYGRMSTFAGKNAMSYTQLDYMLKCAKETRERKTW